MADWLGWAGAATDLYGASQGAGSQSSGSYTLKKNTDPAAINKLIYDVMSSDQGLAALAGGENASGGYGSSTKGLLSQDLVAKIVGNLAAITSEEVKTETGKTKKGTVICTELVRQGLLDSELYDAGAAHFLSLPPQTVAGYQVWAAKVVPLMRKDPLLAKLLAPIGIGRYQFIVNKKVTFWGLATVYIGQPICYLIGSFLPQHTEYLPE